MSVFSTPVHVRFFDLDPDGHVNNAAYATYLEEGRAAYYPAVIGLPLPAANTVISHLEIDYRAPIGVEDDVTVTVDVPELGTSSIPMKYEIVADETVAATADTVQVVWDDTEGTPEPIPAGWRSAIEGFHGLE